MEEQLPDDNPLTLKNERGSIFQFSHENAAIISICFFSHPEVIDWVLFIGILVNDFIIFLESNRLEAAQTFHGRVVLFVDDSFLTKHALGLSLEPSSLFIYRDEVFLFVILLVLVISEGQVDRWPAEGFLGHNLSLDL